MVIIAFRQVGLEDFGESVKDELSNNYNITVCHYGLRVSKLINYVVKVKWQFDFRKTLKSFKLLQLQLSGLKSLVNEMMNLP